MTAGTLLVGVGAGVVSALLTLVIVTGSSLSLLLFFLAPLPIAIASLGWNHKAGLVGAGVGALILGLSPILFGGGVNLRMAAVHAVSTALPAWWFSYLALLARQTEQGAEWYPVGRILAWIAGVLGVMTVFAIGLIATDHDSYVRAFSRAVDMIERINPRLFEDVPEAARQQVRDDLGALVAAFAPPVSAAISVLISAGLMVAAGRVVLASGRLPRPWPHLPALVLPRRLLIALGVTFVGSFLGGFPGLGARILCAALIAAYAAQGLAVLHALTAGRAGRGAILAGVYATSFLLGGWPLLIAALFGVADSLFNIRARRGLAPMADA